MTNLEVFLLIVILLVVIGGEICQLVIQFIDIELAYGNDEEN